MGKFWKCISSLLIFLLFLIVTEISSFANCSDGKIDFKISGGMNYMNVGDWNLSNQGWNDSGRDLVNVTGGTLSGEYKPLHWGTEISGEALFHLSPQAAIGIGAGYIWISEGVDTSLITVIAEGITTMHTHDTEISAVPITASIHYFFPLSSKAKISLSAGTGYYFTKLIDQYRLENDGGYWLTRSQNAKSSGLGFHGGIGLEFSVSRGIALVIEGFGRNAKIKGFEGTVDVADSADLRVSTKGTLYQYQADRGYGWYPVMMLTGSSPSGENIRNEREAEVDFSGFTLRFGLKIKLF